VPESNLTESRTLGEVQASEERKRRRNTVETGSKLGCGALLRRDTQPVFLSPKERNIKTGSTGPGRNARARKQCAASTVPLGLGNPGGPFTPGERTPETHHTRGTPLGHWALVCLGPWERSARDGLVSAGVLRTAWRPARTVGRVRDGNRLDFSPNLVGLKSGETTR
jgi:hypothetical protein